MYVYDDIKETIYSTYVTSAALGPRGEPKPIKTWECPTKRFIIAIDWHYPQWKFAFPPSQSKRAKRIALVAGRQQQEAVMLSAR